ncbi:MAG: AAA family ATPase [Cyanobacteriota bacterium]|nr:AAA family ATPase [Cyanobacteriota bacterium]
MKVRSLQLKYFKKFRDYNLDFTHPETGLARDLVVLIGMNGAGKTSVLQAIAATLGVATGRLPSLLDLDWAGYNYELLGKNWGRFEPEVNLQVQFSKPEIQAIQEFHQKLQQMGRNLPISPAESYTASLQWNRERVIADTDAGFFQFKGREYAKQLLRSEGFQMFERVGTILWYTEQRTSTSLTTEDRSQVIEITDNILRDRLSKWQQIHQNIQSGKTKLQRPGQKDVYAEIEKFYQTVFPKRSFEGPVLREQVGDLLSEPWFYLYDGKNQYEISEMSGGERSIFPILVDFANWNIHNSVILIDELELHLHPPMQQALLRALPKLGNNNQFIITTHSDYIEQLVPEAYIYRLEV